MSNPKVALITFGDPREHEWKNIFSKMAIPRHRQAIDFLQSLPIELYYCDEVACAMTDIDKQVEVLKKTGAEVFIAHNPCWAWPNLVVRGVLGMDLPTVLMANANLGTHATVGLLGAGGALDQIGKPHIRIRADFDDLQTNLFTDKMLPYIRAASAVARLKGKVFGMFGGRSLGIDTGTFDPMQWKAQFGVDADHIDQLEIISGAEKIEPERTEKMVKWLTDNVKSITYNMILTPEKLAYQVRCYLATKDIIAKRNLDFVSIKCMPELTNNYVPQCLSAAFLPGPYDADGDKAPVAMSCEADADAALTMEVLSLISGNAPTMFADVSHLDPETKTLYLPNCGGMCSWFANRSSDPAENLKHMEIRPANRPAGGGITYLIASPGEITLARLYRKAGKYHMAIIEGEVINLEQEKYEEFVKARGTHQLPTAFVKANIDFEHFVDEYAANHIVGIGGHYTKELQHVCEFLNIVPVVMS